MARVGSVRSWDRWRDLAPDDLREIDRAAAGIAIHGARYPDHLQKMGGR